MSQAYEMHAKQVAKDIHSVMGLTFIPDATHLAAGMRQSAHGVVPGVLTQYGPVVAKPHAARRYAHAELDNLESVAEENMPGLKVVEPIGVVSSYDRHILLTYREDIRPLSHLDWTPSSEDRVRQDRLTKTFGRMATVAAALHDRGISHGDLKIWNMAFAADGSFIYFDAEKTVFNENVTESEFGVRICHDLYSMGVSALWSGYLGDIKDNRVRANELSTVLLEPYFDALGYQPHLPVSYKDQPKIVERWTNDARFKPEWLLTVEKPA